MKNRVEFPAKSCRACQRGEITVSDQLDGAAFGVGLPPHDLAGSTQLVRVEETALRQPFHESLDLGAGHESPPAFGGRKG